MSQTIEHARAGNELGFHINDVRLVNTNLPKIRQSHKGEQYIYIYIYTYINIYEA